jgi:hypothetical protein
MPPARDVSADSRLPDALDAGAAVVFLVETARTRFFTKNNLGFPREALSASGGFAEEYVRAAAEDRELWRNWPMRSGCCARGRSPARR